MSDRQESYFLPYQLRWLKDESRIKIWEKSRRIGATYLQSFEDVKDIAEKKVPKVWFTSADESAAKEYIEYCEHWARGFSLAAEKLGEEFIEGEKDIKTLSIVFADGRKITALSSNPKALRSKEGKIVLDEFAHHDNPQKLWEAAKPCITWGYPLRILSTHNGTSALFNRFVEDTRRGKLAWSLHSTPIQIAAEEGLIDKILKHRTNARERKEWLENERRDCGSEDVWQQEYCCVALDGASAFLPYELIYTCEERNLNLSLEDVKGDLFIGMDIGRKKDLTCLWVLERFERNLYTRHFEIIDSKPFRYQKERLYRLISHKNTRRVCIDSTGIGMNLAEDAQADFGKFRVEPVNFTAKVKEEMAFTLKTKFEDRLVTIPSEDTIREDLHSIRKVTTFAGNIRLAPDSSFKESHADRFWALALAIHAASDCGDSIPRIVTRKPNRSRTVLNKF